MVDNTKVIITEKNGVELDFNEEYELIDNNIPFDTTGSDLISDNVGNAIREFEDRVSVPNTIYVALNGNDSTGNGKLINPYATLTGVKDALVAGDWVPSSSNPLLIKLDAGVYTQAPVDFSAYEYINISGAGHETVISASNNSADLLTMGSFSDIEDIEFQGVTNASNWHVVYSTTKTNTSNIVNIYFNGGSNGIKAVNTTGLFRLAISNLQSKSQTDIVLQSNSNCEINATNTTIDGNTTSTKAFVQEGSGILNCLASIIKNSDIVFQVNGNTGRLYITSCDVDNSNNIAFDQNGVSSVTLGNTNFNASNVSIIDTSVIEGSFLNELDDEVQFRLISELSVGLPNRGKESALGEGDSYTNGMKVYTYNGTSYTDVSTAAASNSGSTFSFPNLLVNSAIYITTAFDTTSPLKWYGFKINISTVATLPALGDIVFEYWNGSSWVEFNHMMVNSASPFRSFANDKFTNTGTFQVYFDSNLETNWATNDPVSLGVNLHWIRLRIDGLALTTAPVFEQCKIHTNRMEIEANGFQNMYGKGRIKEKFPITFTGLDPVVGKTPNSQDVYLSDNLAISYSNNSFPSNQNKSIGFAQFIPFELDTSCPLNLTINYFVDSALAGDIAFTVSWATSQPGDSVYKGTAGAPTAFSNERSLNETVSIGLNEDLQFKVFSSSLEIPEAISQQTDGNPNAKVWVKIERDATDVSDTYAGNAIITDLGLFYTAWREGGYSGDFV